jgi:hypothetical protein
MCVCVCVGGWASVGEKGRVPCGWRVSVWVDGCG